MIGRTGRYAQRLALEASLGVRERYSLRRMHVDTLLLAHQGSTLAATMASLARRMLTVSSLIGMSGAHVPRIVTESREEQDESECKGAVKGHFVLAICSKQHLATQAKGRTFLLNAKKDPLWTASSAIG